VAQSASAKPTKVNQTPIGHDHTPQLKRIARVRGQVDGIERMVTAKRYCPEIIQQIKAARSALKALELEIYEGHLKGCVQSALASKNPKDTNKKIDELIALMRSQGN
jgi:CsoR family transcriptional regulator, copper-sensing transcriptional repressor